MRRPDLDIFPSCSRTVSFSLSLPLLVGNFLSFFFSFVFLAWFTNLLLLFQKIPNFDSPQILYSSSRSALSLSDLSAASTKRHFLIIFHSLSLSSFFSSSSATHPIHPIPCFPPRQCSASRWDSLTTSKHWKKNAVRFRCSPKSFLFPWSSSHKVTKQN